LGGVVIHNISLHTEIGLCSSQYTGDVQYQTCLRQVLINMLIYVPNYPHAFILDVNFANCNLAW